MEIYNIAPWWKRILSGLIDVGVIYGVYWFFGLIYGSSFIYLKIIPFIFGIYYFFVFYYKINGTIGDMVLKIKIIFLNKKSNKKILCFIRGLYLILLIGLPLINIFGFWFLCAITIIGTIVFNRKDVVKKNKLLIWDVLSQMVVVEENYIV
jgi:hypothetical protein